MRILFKNHIYETVALDIVTKSPQFKAWFGDSKVVDDVGDPIILYHGSSHDFSTFDRNKTSEEGFFGKGFYFTDSNVDASDSYANPDSFEHNHKIGIYAEHLEGLDPYELSQIIDIPEEELEEIRDNNNYEYDDRVIKEIEKAAKAKFLGHNPTPNIMPVYLRIEKPFYYAFKHTPVYLDLTTAYDEDTEEYDYDQMSGSGYELIKAFERVAYSHDIPLGESELFEILGLEGFTTDQFVDKIKADDRVYDGEPISEVIRAAIELAGYDGIIMNASDTFKYMESAQGATHYIVFNPNQIKSAFNTKPSLDNPNITRE